jgi:hypothetical protein
MGKKTDRTDDFVSKLKALKADGVPNTIVVFRPSPLEISFEERPFGFGVGFDESVNKFLVGDQMSEAAEAKGVKSGWAVTRIGGRSVAGLQLEDLIELLKQVALPANVVFEYVAPKVESVDIDPNEDDALEIVESPKRRKTELGNGSALDPISMEVDLSRPLGIFFDEALLAQDVQPDSQAAELGVRKGWRVCSIAEEDVDKTDDFVARVHTLKSLGMPRTIVSFIPVSLKIAFDLRPFGFPVGYDEAAGKFIVGDQMSEAAEAKGVKPGLAVSRIADRSVDGSDLEEVIELLKQAVLPVIIVFDHVQKVPSDRSSPNADDPDEIGPDVDDPAENCKRREISLENSAESEFDNISFDVDLTQPLGISFDEALLVQDVQPDSQAFRLGVRPGWRLCSIAGESVDKTDALVDVIKSLKAAAVPTVDVAFIPAPLVITFNERPFGFSVGFSEALCRFTVGAASPAAEAKGVQPGMAVCTICDQSVAGLGQNTDAVTDLLRNASLPATVVFVAVPSREET